MEGKVYGGRGGGRQGRMKFECVRCEQGAWRCRGNGDAVDCDRSGRAAEDAPPLPRRTLFLLERELVGAEGCLPCGPLFVSAGEAALVRALLWEATHGEERAGGDCGKPHAVNGELRPDRLLLRVLETINILEDARVVGPPAEHGRKEGDDVGGLKADASAFETGEKFAEGHLIVEGGIFLEGEEPGFLNDGNKEIAPGAFNCLDDPLELNIGGPEAFSLGAHSIGRVGGDAIVIHLEEDLHAFERCVSVLGFVVIV